MRFVRKSLLRSAVAVAGIVVLQLAYMAFAEPDSNNRQTVSSPTKSGQVSVNVGFKGSAPGVQAAVTVTAGMSAREKALEIANVINNAPSNQVPQNQGGGKKVKATVGANGSTITVTSESGFGPVDKVKLAAGPTKEEDNNHGKLIGTTGTGSYMFSGTCTVGTVTVGAGEMRFPFDVSAYASVGELRTAVAATLTANGFTAYVNPEGAILATIPPGVDGVSLCVECETMTADGVGYEGDN